MIWLAITIIFILVISGMVTTFIAVLSAIGGVTFLPDEPPEDFVPTYIQKHKEALEQE